MSSHAHPARQRLLSSVLSALYSPLSHEWTSESERVERMGRAGSGVGGIEAATRTFRLNDPTLTFHFQTSLRTLICSSHCSSVAVKDSAVSQSQGNWICTIDSSCLLSLSRVLYFTSYLFFYFVKALLWVLEQALFDSFFFVETVLAMTFE